MPVPSDADLVQSAQSGDDKAFETLVEKYRIRIFTTIAAFIDNPQDREDIAQETFINAYRNLHQLSMPERFGSWLDTIAQNQCRDWLRKNRIQTVPIDEVEENLLNSDDSPEHSSVEAEQRRIIAQAIDTLPQTEQQIARAHYLENASHDELVSRHSISYQSVSMRLFRAKRKLAKRLRHLLSGAFVPPATTLKKISSGGFTAMKIGTAPKITAGVIAIIALAFFGSRQQLSPSTEVTASTTNKSEQSVAGIDATRKNVVMAPSRAEEPQISTEEMEQIEAFFTQLGEADAQSKIGAPRPAADAAVNQSTARGDTTESSALSESTTQSAEDVMNAYVEAFKNRDFEGMRSLETGDIKERRISSDPIGFTLETGVIRRETEFGTVIIEDPDVAEEARLQLERLMFEPVLNMINQAEVVGSGYVGDEFHFRLGMPAPEMPMPSGEAVIETTIPPPPDMLIKMRKETGAWQIYDTETLN